MSVADLSLFNSLSYALDGTTGNLQQLEQQLGTGKRVNSPSDNPPAFAEGEMLTQQQSVVTNDVAIASAAQGQLNSIDGELAQTNSALDTAIQDATQGADGTLNSAQMAAIGTAVGGLLTEVIGAANFQYGGAYVFAGNQALTTPYDSGGNYYGDSGANAAQLTDGTRLPLTFNGQVVFGDSASGAIGALVALQTALNTGDQAGVAATLTQLQAAVTQIAQVRSGIGATINTASAAAADGNATLVGLASTLTKATGLDVAQAAVSVQEINLQEEALVSLGSDLGKLPLINVLA